MRKKPSKSSITAIRYGQVPTKERRRQNGGMITEVVDRDSQGRILMRRYKAVWECPLDAYLDHKAISPSEYQAGFKFRRAYYMAVLSKRTIYGRRSPNTQLPLNHYTNSEKLLKAAYRKVSPHYIGAIIDICGYDQPARNQTKLDKLQKGLEQLSAAWGMAAVESCVRP